MSDTNNPGDKTAERGPRKPLSLKRPIEQGVVRQSFSHGRTKQVMVETVKRRVGAPANPAPTTPAPRPAANARPAGAAPAGSQRPPQRPAAGGVVLRTLSEQESAARAAALADAQRREADARRKAEEDAAAQRAAAEAEARRQREEAEARRRAEEEAARAAAEAKAAEEAARKAAAEAQAAAAAIDEHLPHAGDVVRVPRRRRRTRRIDHHLWLINRRSARHDAARYDAQRRDADRRG